jgi:hypothetical protein
VKAYNLFQSLEKNGIIGSVGITTFELNGINVNVNDVSIVGNVLQEWLMHYMKENNISFRMKDNSQEFPDYLLNEKDNTVDLLEVKAFTKSPNFDVANFEAYARSLREHAYRLDAQYLIFKYSRSKNPTQGICIDKMWLKNVWEICCGSERSEIKIQWKQGNPINIRPCVWYGNPKYPPFNSRREFVDALYKVIRVARIDSSIQKDWFSVVKQNYEEHTGNTL